MNLFVQEAGAQDILDQVEWYAGKGLPEIARRFHGAVLNAIDALIAMQSAAPPKPTGNPSLVGLRAWPVAGFDVFGVYYLLRDELLIVVRVLHDKRSAKRALTKRKCSHSWVCSYRSVENNHRSPGKG